MTNRLHHIIYLFFATMILTASCEKLEMPDFDDDGDDSEKTESPSDPSNSGDSNNDSGAESGNYDENDPYQGWGSLENMIEKGGTINCPYRAKDLAKGELGEWVVSAGVESMPNCWIEGYIVGYVKGNSMSSAVLFKKSDSETNILIASDTINIDASDCVPIGLAKGDSYIKTRKALNLKDNPELMRRKVKILGSISKYMGAAGLRNARDYRFSDGK